MENKKKERRKNKRYLVQGVYGNVIYPSDLMILNMSIDGAAIETPKRLDINREYTFKIKYKNKNLSLKGIVVWSLLTSRELKDRKLTIPVYRAGIRFTDTLNEKTTKLIDFIEENKIRTLERRVVGVRFKIASKHNARIDYPYKYEVKRMSLSGMLVETRYPLKIDDIYNIELFLNENMLNINVRIVSCKEINEDNVKKYMIGIEFKKLSDRDKKIIENYIKTLENI